VENVFEIGEIAILQNIPSPFAFMNGEECEITGPLEVRTVQDIRDNMGLVSGYRISYRGNVGVVCPENLRKKKLPPENRDTEFGVKVEWSDCAWNPLELEIEA